MDKAIKVRVADLEVKTGIVKVAGYCVLTDKEWEAWESKGLIPVKYIHIKQHYIKAYHEDVNPANWDKEQGETNDQTNKRDKAVTD